MTVSNSRNPSRVYIRQCEHGKRFLLLNKEQPYYDWNFSAAKHKQSQFNLHFWKISNNISLLLVIKLLK